MNKKIKILHIQLLPILSGAQRVSLDELVRLPTDKYEKFLICSAEGDLTEEAKKFGVRVTIIPSLVREISLLNDFKTILKLIKYIKENKINIVHSHSSKPGVLGRISARLAGVNLIFHTVHGYSFSAAKNWWSRKLYEYYELIAIRFGKYLICLHNNDANISINKLSANPNYVFIIPNGVDTEKFHPLVEEEKKQKKSDLGFKSDEIVIGMVGRLWEQKNPLFLINSLLPLLKQSNQLRLVFVGDGELYKDIVNLAKINEITEKVTILGWRRDVNSILNAFDIFCLPSLWEGMPLAILEAQSCGLPCIVSNIEGNKSVVTHNFNGLTFVLEDEVDFSNKISLLINSEELRLKLGKNARERILQEFCINQRISKIDNLYDTKAK